MNQSSPATSSAVNESSHIAPNIASGEQETMVGKSFGTFSGVFRPTILTILGIMMYLREGWVVGNAGLGGAILIILMAYLITGTTALSISSITTNIRLGAGGVFSMVSQSLGLEVGGSIGIPFYLAQGLSTSMYIYGFAEGWLYLFPQHPPTIVSLIVFAVVFLCSYISTSLAFRVQVIVMCGVIVALSSIFLGFQEVPTLQTPQLWGDFPQADFWELFAIFFPAATGILVGASMSGNLTNPRKSIPIGTLVAWVVSLFVYLSLAIWYAFVASTEELISNFTIAVDRSAWAPGVLVGIMSSCFTAALSSFVAAPRILQSLGSHNIVPYARFFGQLHHGEPRKAMLFTGGMVFIVLLVGNLNTIAQVLTMFFLVTYFTINSVLVLEQRLNLISFRPTFRISQKIPLIGAFSCLSAMIIISPFWGLIAILLSVSIYIYLNNKDLKTPWETVQSSLLHGIANWAAKKVAISPTREGLRSWKPDLLVPIYRRTQLDGLFRLLRSVVYSQGSIQIVAFMKDHDIMPLLGLKQVVKDMQNENFFASSAIIESTNFLNSLATSVAVMKGSFFQPNTIFLLANEMEQADLQGTLEIAVANKMGTLIYVEHQEARLGKERHINLWIRDQSPNWKIRLHLGNIDLSLLIGYKLIENWDAHLRILSVLKDQEDLSDAKTYFTTLMKTTRIPQKYEIHVESETPFMEFIGRAPRADLNIFGLSNVVDKSFLELIVQRTKSSCLFVLDSGKESAIA